MSEDNKAIARRALKEVFIGQGDLNVVDELLPLTMWANRQAYDSAVRKRLWALSEELCGRLLEPLPHEQELTRVYA